MNRIQPISRRWLTFLLGIVLTFVVMGGAVDTRAQTLVPPDASVGPSTPPVSLESGFAPTFPAPAGTVPPLSIGPAPTSRLNPAPFYPPPGFPYDRQPIFVRPPAFGSPAFGPTVATPFGPGPIIMAPQPVRATTNFGPRESDFGRGPNPVEVRRPSGPANLRLTVSESFLNRAIAQERVDPGPVRDLILGAQVTGRQKTVSKLRVDFIPSSDTARVALVLNGDVQSLTTGVTPQAMIDTVGQQQFVGVKEVYFDGVQLTTRHATVYIRASNQTIGATTALTGTLLGGFADRIAYRAAERQKAAGEAVARERLAEKLFPTFDGEIDAQLAKANQQLEPLRKWLDAAKLLPSSQSVWTTDTQLLHELFLGDAKSATAIPPVNEPADGENGLRLSIHESLLNTLADRVLKGYRTTDKKLRELEKLFTATTAADTPSSADDASALPETNSFVTDIEFDDVEPFTIRLERDRMVVTVKAQFKPAGQSLVPPMTVTIPYQTEMVGNKIRLVAGKPRIVAQDRADPSAPQTFLETTIQKLVEAELIPLEVDRVLPANLWPAAGAAPRVTSIKSDNGWVSIAID